jgi:AcrR family transcriptional regulator
MKPANRARHRRHLVEAATAIVARDGLAGLTFRSAADEVGTTTAPFTYAFGTKDDLLLAVARHAWESVWGPIDDPASSAEGQADAVERLRLLLERSVPLMQPAPMGLRAYAEIFFQNLRDPSLRPILAESSEWSRLLRRRHVALLRAAQKDGAIDRRHDPNHLVWPFYQLVGGLLVESLYYPDHLPPKLLPRLWERGFSALVASRPTAANSPIAVHAANPTGDRVDDPHMESLIDAALEVVARDGLSGLTFRAAARELGTTTAPFTYAFGSKSAMLEALGERVFFDVWPLETPPMDATPLDRLRLRYERALPLHRPVRSELRAYAELFFQNLRNPELARTRATSVDWSKTINRDLARLVDDARDAGEITGEGRASDLLILLDAIAGGLLIVGLHYPRYLPAARLRANWATIFAALTGSDSG